MWDCPKCGRRVKDSDDLCWNCGASGRSVRSAEHPIDEPTVERPVEPPHDPPQTADLPDSVDPPQPLVFPQQPGSQEPPKLGREFQWLGQYDQGPEPKIAPAWRCPGCGETVDGNFDVCWNCQTDKSGKPPADARGQPDREAAEGDQAEASRPSPRVAFRHFRDRWKSWEELFQEAADFAGTVGPQRLISISHSADQSDGVVTVWYWKE